MYLYLYADTCFCPQRIASPNLRLQYIGTFIEFHSANAVSEIVFGVTLKDYVKRDDVKDLLKTEIVEESRQRYGNWKEGVESRRRYRNWKKA
jgi:hypothetical protein